MLGVRLPTPTTLKFASMLELRQARNLDDILRCLPISTFVLGLLRTFEIKMLTDTQKALREVNPSSQARSAERMTLNKISLSPNQSWPAWPTRSIRRDRARRA